VKIIQQSERAYAGPRLARISHWIWATTFIVCFVPAVTAQTSLPKDESGSSRVSAAGFPDKAADGGSTQRDHSDAPTVTPKSIAGQDDLDNWVTKWLSSVDKARSEQPHYVAPIVTTHVLLVQQYRYDSSWQTNSDGSQTANYGNGRGLEIIPNTRMEVQIAPPPYIVHSSNIADGNGDTSLFVKFRAFSAPEGKGDYFVGLFLGASFPSGSPPNGLGHTVLSPMLALAKAWGPLSIQNTFSGSLPTGGTNVLGRAFLWNTTFQYGIKGKIWPMIEQNSTFFSDGPDSGKKQTFLTPGVVFGMFQIAERLRFGTGVGVQIAATQFHTYNHRWIWTVRFPF
jgi:hypothetical protein